MNRASMGDRGRDKRRRCCGAQSSLPGAGVRPEFAGHPQVMNATGSHSPLPQAPRPCSQCQISDATPRAGGRFWWRGGWDGVWIGVGVGCGVGGEWRQVAPFVKGIRRHRRHPIRLGAGPGPAEGHFGQWMLGLGTRNIICSPSPTLNSQQRHVYVDLLGFCSELKTLVETNTGRPVLQLLCAYSKGLQTCP